MALLDFLNSPSSGGLLDFLRQNAMNQQFPSGMASDQAQYGQQPILPSAPSPQGAPQTPQPSPLDSAQWPYGPNGTPSQANAAMPGLPGTAGQPAPQTPPPAQSPQPMQAPQGPGIGDRLLAGLQGFAAPSTGGLIGHLAGGISGIANGQTASNLTAQVLIAKGVDPTIVKAAIGNPEIMKTLITQAFGPQTVTSLGQGYVADRNGKITRAYTPDDKTPSGFSQADDGTMHFVPGGPADPAYMRLKEEQGGTGGLSLNPIYGKDAEGNTVLLQAGKNGVAVQSKLPSGVTLNGVDNQTLASDAARLNEGDDTVLKKYSNKGQGRIDLLRLNNEANRQRSEAGLAPIDITQNRIALQGDVARERAAGNMEGRMAPAAVEAQGAFQIAREASENLARTNFVPYNKILQAGEAAFSNPELKAAATAYNTAVMTYSKAITPTGVGTVTAQEHARQILETADGPQATKAAFDQLSREVDMAHQSPGLARQYFADARKAKMEGRPPPPMPTYQQVTPSAVLPATAGTAPLQPGASTTINGVTIKRIN
jgi:hypothetical protein